MNRKGFTLILLLIVLVTICICAWISIVYSSNPKAKAYIASMKSDLRNLVTAEEAYFADSVKYTARSEERRVGKECRSRWWANHEKKNGVSSPAAGNGSWGREMTNTNRPNQTAR